MSAYGRKAEFGERIQSQKSGDCGSVRRWSCWCYWGWEAGSITTFILEMVVSSFFPGIPIGFVQNVPVRVMASAINSHLLMSRAMFASKRREVMLSLKLNLLDIELSARAIKGSHLLIIRQQQ